MALPLFMQTMANALMLSAFYIVLATGLTIIFSVMRMINFCYGALYMVGAIFIFYWVSLLGLNYFVGLVVVVAVMYVLAWTLNKFLLRRVRGDLWASIIVTLGLLMLLEGGASIVFGGDPRYFDSPITGIVRLGTVLFSWERLVPAAMALIIMLILWWFLKNTKSGMSLRATSQNEGSAVLQGVNVEAMGNLAWGLGTGLSAVAAVMMAPVFGVSNIMGGPVLWKSFVVIIIGGMGSIPGVILGGALLGFMDSFITTYVNMPSAMIAGFVLIIVILIFRPRGFMGAKED